MTVKATMPAPGNLVLPLDHKPTATRQAETAASRQAASAAVSTLIGSGLRRGDVSSSHPAPAPGIRTSTTATRTTTTSVLRPACVLSADITPFAFPDLVQAYIDCRRHKRGSASCQQFEARLERNLLDLYHELTSGQWHPGRSICFAITHPKPREVWAAQFRDRIVHHLLYNHIAPRFEATFVHGSCACIPGRGTLYGARLLESYVRSVTQNWSRPAFYLKVDLANFFVAIDKRVLWQQLATKLPEPQWCWLAHTILFHDPRSDVEVQDRACTLHRVPPHKSLFNAPPDTGLPIGNLSSQFFANVHLNALDQFCKHRLPARHYVRYVDDVVILHESSQWLSQAHQRIAQWLPERLGARLNPTKTIIQPVDRGVDFVGQVIKPWHRSTRARTLRSAIERIRTLPDDETYASGNSYLGLVRQSGSSRNEQRMLAKQLLRRGHAVDGAWERVFRKGNET